MDRSADADDQSMPLKTLPLAELLREVRTAERLRLAIPAQPAEEAAVHVATLEAGLEACREELRRRDELFEIVRRLPARCG